MGRNQLPPRHAPYTTETLTSDTTIQRGIVLQAGADFANSITTLLRLVNAPDVQRPMLGLGGRLIHPEPIDRAALQALQTDALRDVQRVIDNVQALLDGVAVPR